MVLLLAKITHEIIPPSLVRSAFLSVSHLVCLSVCLRQSALAFASTRNSLETSRTPTAVDGVVAFQDTVTIFQ